MWGPRFPAIEEIFKEYSLLEACAIQWKVSIENIKKFKKNNKNIKILEIKYENLINFPKKNIQKIINYLNLDNKISKQKIDKICKLIIKDKKDWKNILTPEEKKKISKKLLKSTLEKLGY